MSLVQRYSYSEAAKARFASIPSLPSARLIGDLHRYIYMPSRKPEK